MRLAFTARRQRFVTWGFISTPTVWLYRAAFSFPALPLADRPRRLKNGLGSTLSGLSHHFSLKIIINEISASGIGSNQGKSPPFKPNSINLHSSKMANLKSNPQPNNLATFESELVRTVRGVGG